MLKTRKISYEGVSFAFLSIEILLISWLGGGGRMAFIFPMMWVALAAYFAMSFAKTGAHEDFLEKSVFWSGLALVLFIVIQYLNPNFEYIVTERYNYLKPIEHISCLPGSVKSTFYEGNALSSLSVIATTLLVFISALSVFKITKFAIICLVFFALNATAMSVWGIYQKCEQFPILYGMLYSSSEFYGSFYMANAGGAFINLGLAANFALFFLCARSKMKLWGYLGC